MTSVTLCLSGRPFRRRAVLDPSRTACPGTRRDRKSTRLNSSHSQISYAVFCLKKKKHTVRLADDGDCLDPGALALAPRQHRVVVGVPRSKRRADRRVGPSPLATPLRPHSPHTL